MRVIKREKYVEKEGSVRTRKRDDYGWREKDIGNGREIDHRKMERKDFAKGLLCTTMLRQKAQQRMTINSNTKMIDLIRGKA